MIHLEEGTIQEVTSSPSDGKYDTCEYQGHLICVYIPRVTTYDQIIAFEALLSSLEVNNISLQESMNALGYDSLHPSSYNLLSRFSSSLRHKANGCVYYAFLATRQIVPSTSSLML
jgi:hypothetical protein